MTTPDKFSKQVDKAVQWAEGQVLQVQKKNPVGRPSSYTPELIEKAWEYVNGWSEMGHRIPSNAGLAIVLGITRDTIQKWALDKEKVEFSYILGQIQSMQEFTLMDKGLGNEFNSAICKLALGKHGYHEKHDHQVESFNVNITGKDADML